MMDKYRNLVKAMTSDGEIISLDQYQEEAGLKGTQIGNYFSYMEPCFLQDIHEYDELIVCIPLMEVLDLYREAKASSVMVNSFNRTKKKQLSLAAKGYKTAKFSPHVEKMGSDVDTSTKAETIHGAGLILAVARDAGIGVRVGYRQYIKIGQTFIHIDVCPMYYAPGKPFHHLSHPKVWEDDGRTW